LQLQQKGTTLVAPNLQKYYEESFNMMSTQGWTDLLEDFQKLKDSLNNLSLVTDTQDLYFRKGQIDILDLILKRKDTCEQVYEELQNEDSE
jgi:hypothetical protein